MQFYKFLFIFLFNPSIYGMAHENLDNDKQITLENGKIIQLSTVNKPSLIISKPNMNLRDFPAENVIDPKFGFIGKITIPIKSKDLKLRYNPNTESIFVIDTNTSDIIVYSKKGEVILKFSGKESNFLSDSEARYLYLMDNFKRLSDEEVLELVSLERPII